MLADAALPGVTQEVLALEARGVINQAAINAGRVFETEVSTALNLPKNTELVTQILDNGSVLNAIPDGLTDTIILEVKDVKSLSLVRQFRTYFAQGKVVDLVVSSKTTYISSQLQQAVQATGGTIKVFDPLTKTFSTWVP